MLTNLRRSLAGTTVLMVASRPSTIALADEVVYLAGGQVVDHGPHDELMARQRRLPRPRRGVRDRPGDDDAASAVGGGGWWRAVDEPIGRFAAVHTINRGLQEAPVLRQGLALTWCLAAVGATGRVVVPILLQQAIDKGIVGDGRRARRLRRRAVPRSPPSPCHRRRRPAHGRRPPRPAQRAGALPPAGAPDRPHPPAQPRRPQRGAPRRARRPGHERHRDAGPVLPVGRPGLAARRPADADGRRP